jgi:hypothetical protein
MKTTSLVIFLTFFVAINFLSAQIRDSSISILQCEINYSYHFPGGDMAKRFGNSSTVGLGVNYKTPEKLDSRIRSELFVWRQYKR